jgi:transcriptional regulator with XRE-family HTH domain/mannose-6-phosphate isomerase-like protein (cupin superfamily)
MTLRELARRLGVSPSFVSQLENGKSQPSVATLYSITQLLDVSIDHLFEDRGEPDPAPAGGRPARAEQTPVDHVVPPPEEHAEAAEPCGADQVVSISRALLATPGDAFGERPAGRGHLSVTAPGNRMRLVMDCGVVWEQLARTVDSNVDFMEIHYPPGSSSTTDERMLRHDGYEYGYLLEGQLEVTVGFDRFTLRAGEAVGLDSAMPHLFRNLGSTPARGIWFVHHRHD